MTIASKITEFGRSLAEERCAARNTVSSYERDLRRFAAYLESENIDECADVTEETVRRYIESMEAEGKAPATVSRSAAALKSFFSFAMRTGAVLENLIGGVSAPPLEKGLPHILTSGDVEALLRQPSGSDAKSMRDKAMLELLYATGVRVSEFVALDVGDVNLTTGLMCCRGRNKERYIPVYPLALEALGAYISRARGQLCSDPDESALFVNRSGERMSRQGFWKLVKHYQKKAGIDKHVTPQTLRNSFAAHLLENGADLHSLQELLGHSGVASTSVYTQLIKKHLKDAYNTAHPKA
ncbi:MAG: tyrosine recombinase [Oscillospiraceae bacterium]|jgi:integrase/recombinase XerD|nr:tyrosine recombinase [Oscillospiraceae bacterium]